MQTPRLANIEECTGCAACMSTCSHKAISFRKDVFGFAYPEVDQNLCVDCKMCENVCPVRKPNEFNSPIVAYACHVTNDEEREKSSSGGIATLLAKHYVEHGGIVYGCAFIPPMKIKHIRCSNIEDVDKLRGSKYVQSDLVSAIPLIEKDLRAGLQVLFIGTPCQADGIRSKFKRFKNLTLVDLVCHGVPSIQFLQDTLPRSINWNEVKTISFRRNNDYKITISGKDAVILRRPLQKDIFFKGFFTGLLFRQSCYTCKYANIKRISDITLADFWGLKSEHMIDNERGISLVLINSEKGGLLFDKIKSQLIYEQRPLQEAQTGNAQLNHPYKKTIREAIFKWMYPKFGYNVAIAFAIPDRIIGTKILNLFKR